jgi:hypothetical protein
MTELSPQPPEQSRPAAQNDQVVPISEKSDHQLQTDNSQRPPTSAESGLNLLSIGAEAMWNAGVREPVRGFVQLANKVPGINITVPEHHELTKTQTTLGWAAQQIGSGLGMIAPFKLASAIRPLLLGEGLVGTARATVDGAFYGAVLTPSDDPTSNFWTQRGVSSIVGGVGFGTQHGLAQLGMGRLGLGDIKTAANPWPIIGTRLGINTASGGLAGFFTAETNSVLTTGDFASADDVKQSMASFMVTGFGLDALHVGKDLVTRSQSGSDTAFSGIAGSPPLNGAPPEARTIGVRGPVGQELPFVGNSIGAENGRPLFAPEENLRVADMEPRTKLEQNISRQEQRIVPPEEIADIKVHGEELRDAVRKNLTILSGPAEAAQSADFDRLMQAVERRTSSTDQGEVTRTYKAVTDLLNAPKLQVDLLDWQKFALAKQILAQTAEPNSITQGLNMTCGALAVEQMAMYNNPGSQARAIVDVLTKGSFTTDTKNPMTVDLSRSLMEKIDEANGHLNVFTRTLAPDIQARASLEASAQPGSPFAHEGMRSYASQLSQLIDANIKWQTLVPESERAVYAVTMRDPLLGDSGERRLALSGEQALRPIMTGSPASETEPVLGPGLESRDIQPIFDALTGKDSSKNNFVLLNTKEALTAQQGTRFIAPVELERLLLAGNRPFVVEVDPDHPLFRLGDTPPDDRRPTRHVVTVSSVLHPETGENLLRGDRPLFNVTDGLGRASAFTGENGLTAHELYEASLHPSDSRRIEVPVALPGVRNFGKIDESVFRGQRPESLQGIRSLKKEGVTLIVDMIDNPVMQGDITREQAWANKTGIRYINLKTGVKNLDMKQIRKIIAEIDAEVNPADGRPPGKVFIHCARGADRTGVVDAVWNVTHNDWSAREALAKMRQYRWSEQMHYAKRMGSMVGQVAPSFLPENAPAEAREIGARVGTNGSALEKSSATDAGKGLTKDFPLLELTFADQLTALRENQRHILSGHANGGGLEHLLHREVTQSLARQGLAAEGWEIFSSEKESPLDRSSVDFLLVNKHTGEAHLLDGTGSFLKTGTDESTPSKRIPIALEPGLIRYTAADVGRTGEADDRSIAAWKQNLDDQIASLTELPAYFDLRYTPFPDFRVQPPAVAYEQVNTFKEWLKARAKPDGNVPGIEIPENETPQAARIYADYADYLVVHTLGFLAGEAHRIESPAFEQRATGAATNALLDWSLSEMLHGRGKTPVKPSPEYHLDSDRFKIYDDKLDGSAESERFRLIFLASDGRQTQVQLGAALNTARVALTKTTSLTVEQARERLATSSNKEAAQQDLRDAQLSEKIDRRLEMIKRNYGISITRQMFNQFLSSADARQRIARGGGQRNSAEGPIVQSMVEYLRAQNEATLLGQTSAKPVKLNAATPNLLDQTMVEQMQGLGLKPDSPADEVALGLALIAGDVNLPPQLKTDIDALVEAYSLEPATKKVACRKADAERRIQTWLEQAAAG